MWTAEARKGETERRQPGEMLYQRKDDTPEALKTRLGVYHKNTAAILKFYNEVFEQRCILPALVSHPCLV
eukprot:344904-Amorphochlora_amoeboformis.AAC.1